MRDTDATAEMLGDVLSDAFEETLGEENTHMASKLGVLMVLV